jgi:hypothetical protein
MPAGKDRNSAMQGAISAIAESDSEAALKLVSELPPGLQDDSLGL